MQHRYFLIGILMWKYDFWILIDFLRLCWVNISNILNGPSFIFYIFHIISQEDQSMDWVSCKPDRHQTSFYIHILVNIYKTKSIEMPKPYYLDGVPPHRPLVYQSRKKMAVVWEMYKTSITHNKQEGLFFCFFWYWFPFYSLTSDQKQRQLHWWSRKF